jgi:hypothetical protein
VNNKDSRSHLRFYARMIYSLRCMRDVIETLVVEKLEARLDEMAERAVSNATERQQQSSGASISLQ